MDDEPDLRALLADALHAADLHVSTAASGREAIDLATRCRPDLLIADLRLGDCSGLEVIDRLRRAMGEIPAVVITGYGDAASLSEASRRRPVELMTKPLNLERLRSTVREELDRQDHYERTRRRSRRLRRLARTVNLQRKQIQGELDTTCAELTSAYRTLSGQMSLQQVVIVYQNELIAAHNDDDVFKAVFRLFAARSGPVFGVAMACDENAQLKVIGRFGVPRPDNLAFCEKLAWPLVDATLTDPRCMLIDAGDQTGTFDESIRKHLPGLTILSVPLIPAPGELIGLAILYRKGEQPFTDHDMALAEMIAFPTATAIRRND